MCFACQTTKAQIKAQTHNISYLFYSFLFQLLGAFTYMAKSSHYLRHACLSISARPHWTDFRATYFRGLLKKSVENFQISLKSNKIPGNLRFYF